MQQTNTYTCTVCGRGLGCGHERHVVTRERGTPAQELARARRLAERAPEWAQWAWDAEIAELEAQVRDDQ